MIYDVRGVIAFVMSTPPEVLLEHRLFENTYYPFTYTGKGSTLEICDHHETYYFSAATLFISTVISIIWLAIDKISNGLLPLAVMTAAVSAAVLYNVRHVRRYILYPNECQYEFASGDQVHVRGDFSNIYIRLHRETVESIYGQRAYYLVLNGYEMDRQILCAPSPNLEVLRKIGQRIASNLNINYFDETNISKHHVIRHFRRETGVFSYR